MLQESAATQSERNWAMLAHLTALLTVLVGLHSGGVGSVVALLVPLGMYLYFRERSPYVAFHALQATVFQASIGIAWVVVGAIAGTVLAGAWVVTGLLSIVLVGLLLVPFALGLTFLTVIMLLALPVLGLVYPVRGAYLTYSGRPFEYPWVGALAARTMASPLTPDPSPLS
ncbi:MAG: putative rane protein [Anaerolineales bacterium]|nr:putative rane protein [Anaerolineales bacterium]